MCNLLRFFAFPAWCIIAAPLISYAADGSNALYVFSAPNQIQASVELVRMEGDKIVSRTPLGFSVARGASRSRLIAFGVQDGKLQLRTWDPQSGALLSDIEVKNLEVPYIPVLIGVANGLTVNEADNQVVYVGIQSAEAPRTSRRGKAAPRPTYASWFAAVDMSTGESFKIKPPEGAPIRPQWSMVNGKLGTRLEDGSFAIYWAKSQSFSEVIEIEGIAKEWSTFIPGIGLAKEIEDGWQVLSDENLAPLAQPIDVAFEAGTENMRGIFKLANGHIGRWSVVRTGDDASHYTVFDVTANAEIACVTYPLAASSAFRSEDGDQLLLVDDEHKKALWVNSADSTTSGVNFSWASLPHLTPVFEE